MKMIETEKQREMADNTSFLDLIFLLFKIFSFIVTFAGPILGWLYSVWIFANLGGWGLSFLINFLCPCLFIGTIIYAAILGVYGPLAVAILSPVLGFLIYYLTDKVEGIV